MNRIIIAGSRDFLNYERLTQELNRFIEEENLTEIEIVSGAARGADLLGERYAKETGYKIKQFPADWNRFGAIAGPMRNSEMSKYADHCIVFWDGKSRGTKSMIGLAKAEKLNLRIIMI